MPLLLNLARKPVFLHDNSVRSLDCLLTQTRGPKAPPDYVKNKGQCAGVVFYLKLQRLQSRSMSQPRSMKLLAGWSNRSPCWQ